jgi:phage tail protein X
MACQDQYTTSSRDMWDAISFAVYGTEKFVSELMQANPSLIDIAVFDAGVQIVCPDIAVAASAQLPPWRQ